MDRRVVAVIGTAVFALLAFVSTSAKSDPWHGPTASSGDIVITPDTIPPPDQADAGEPGTPGQSNTALPILIKVIGIVLLAALTIVGLVALIGALRTVRWRRHEDAPFEMLPELPDVIADDAARQIEALLQGGSPRNAIVECWLRLEETVASAGLPRHPAETSAEFTARVLAAHTLDGAAIGDLAALYREARFSRHDLDESARRRALEALRAVHADLGSRASDSVAAG